MTTQTIKKIFTVTMLVATVLLFTGCDDEPQSSQGYTQHVNRAESYIERGQFKAAVIEAKNALQKGPERSESHLLMARIFLEIGQASAALKQLEEITDTETPEYVLIQVESFNVKRKFKSAEKVLNSNKTLLTQSNNNLYLELLATSQLGQGNINEAEKLLTQLLSSSTDKADTLVSLAFISENKGDTDQTQSYLEQALEKDPDNTRAHLLKAQIYQNNNNISEAENSLTDALASLNTTDIITPQRAKILTKLADILTQQGRISEALIYTRILAEALPGKVEIRTTYEEAIAAIEKGELKKAETLLEDIIAKNPNFLPARQVLGIIKYNRGEFESASQHLTNAVDPEIAPEVATMAFAMASMRLNNPEKVLELLGDKIKDSQDTEILGLYGLAALYAGQDEKGENTLLKALTINPQKSRLRLALAQLYNNQQEQQKALKQLEQAYKSTPNDAYLQKALLSQYMILKMRSKADSLITQIEKNSADNIDSLIIIATYQNLSGDNSQAIQTMQNALEISANNIEALETLGKILVQSKQIEKAYEHFNQTISVRPEVLLGYKGLITVFEMEQKSQQGIKEVTQLLDTTTYSAPYAVLIEYYARNNNFEKANELLATAKQRFPTDTKVKTLTAQLSVIEGAFALSKQDIPKARILLMKGLQAKPNDTRLQSLLVKTEIAAKNFLEASKITDQLAINNGNLAMLMRGDIAFAKEKYTIALNHYQTLWDNASSDTVANRIITIYNTQDDPDGKTRFIDIWGEKLPNSPNMLLMRGIQHISSGRYKQSITDLEKLRSLQKNKVSPIVLNNLAWAYLKTQNLAKAIQDAEKAYQLAPESAAIADTYGWILHNTEQQDKAIEILQIANKLDPESEEIRQHLNIAKGIPGF